MIKSISFKNWKSFRDATLYIDPLTVLIGTNASGKSNVLDGLQFLSRLTQGKTIETAMKADRGGLELASFNQNEEFTLEAVIQGEAENIEYCYSISIRAKQQIPLSTELLTRREYDKNQKTIYQDTPLFWINKNEHLDSNGIMVRLFTKEKADGSAIGTKGLNSILSRLNELFPGSLATNEEFTYFGSFVSGLVVKGIKTVSDALKDIFVLNPVSSSMRSYSTLAENLEQDASNIAGVLANLSSKQKELVEAKLAKYVTRLPEGDICRVWAEPVGRLAKDAMLYAEEQWVAGLPCRVVDAQTMSDGTLHFLAVLTALITRPAGSLLAIEEVDNGLHPSRAELLLQMLEEVGSERKIDVLITTHNDALLNALGPETFPFVTIANRDPQTGESKLTLLEDVEDLPRLIASGMIGDMAAHGSLERSLRKQEAQKDESLNY